MPVPSSHSSTDSARVSGMESESPLVLASRLAEVESLRELHDSDRLFLATQGVLKALDPGRELRTRLAEEEQTLGIVLRGAVRLPARAMGEPGAVLSAGGVFGAEAVLEAKASPQESGPIYALEPSEVLLVPARFLKNRSATAPAFAARLLRFLVRSFLAQDHTPQDCPSDVRALEASLESMRSLLFEADREAIAAGGVIPTQKCEHIRQGFRELVLQMNAVMGEASGRSEAEREALGRRVQRSFLPYLLLTTTSERLYAKPRGYAGDSVSIDGIYANNPSGTGRLGPLLDRCFLDEPAAQAVRNRRGLLCEEIEAVLEQHPERTVHITTMACGPAREVFDVFAKLDDPTRLQVQLIDFDEMALAQVEAEAAALGLSDQLILHHANLVDLALGRKQLELPPQDLVYSIGLIDYFVDKLVVKLMSYGCGLLREGGQMILGNFHPRNEDKALMDFVLDWRLIHRDEEDLERLYRSSSFDRGCTRLRFEDAGVNLFAVCRKERLRK